MLTCREVEALVTSHLDHRLSFSRGIAFRLHVAMCRNCRAHLHKMKQLVASLASLPHPEPPEAVLDAYRRWLTEQNSSPAPPEGSAR
jgi:anti-sigma factor RsiW